MATYNHGVRILESATPITAPITGTAGLQVVFGTAPINLAADPYSVTNTPIIAYDYAEAVSQLGYSDDYDSYTLCQSIYASFKVLGVAPVVFINVLDPTKHIKEGSSEAVTVTNMQATVAETGILADTLKVQADEAELVAGTDYITEFDSTGGLIITLTATGAGANASSLTLSYKALDPSKVTADDVIGTYNAQTGKDSGLEVLSQVYPKLGLTPGLLLAPGWSHKADVGIALAAKCEEINGVFTCECLVDLDSTSEGAIVYTNVQTVKNDSGCNSAHAMALWPCVKVGSKKFWYSAIMGATIAYVDANNDDVPYLSPSNKLVGITGTCLADGTEVTLDQVRGNMLNGQGITTAINNGGWKTWGNNTAIYPNSTDPKDRWFCCRRFFSWWGNSFILTYADKVDGAASLQLIENIVDSENIRGNAYVSAGKCAGAKMSYVAADNSTTDIINGKVEFTQTLAPWPPAEDIVNNLSFDPDMLTAALNA
jgi:hypothetical protein